jgi:hypothetical protein
MATARRLMTCRAGTEHRKIGSREDPTVERRQGKGQECKNGIRNRGLKDRLRLGSKGTVNEVLRKNFLLEVVK